jgi:hypothetical protein
VEPTSPSNSAQPAASDPDWLQLVSFEHIQALRHVQDTMRKAGVNVLVGGAFALARHVGRWRGTKDVDFFIRPADREKAVNALLSAGFEDYYDRVTYDRSWIFRGHRSDALVDLIWTLPNHVTEVDDRWYQYSVPFTMGGDEYRVIPAEELIRIKMYVMQRDRCDWPDVINLLRITGPQLDWARLLGELGDDVPLAHAVLILFNWLAPDQARTLPDWVRARFALPSVTPEQSQELERTRTWMLDSRPWYAAFLTADRPMAP